MILCDFGNRHMDRMKSFRRLGFLGVLFLAVPCAQADVMYQCVDEHGNKTFSNVKSSGKGAKCTTMNLGPSTQPSSSSGKPSAGSGSAKTPSPSSFPKVEGDVQKERDNDRKRILESELSTEQKNLEEARKELAEQEATRLGNERNYQKVLDRLEPYKNKVALHERNIEAIRRELAKVR